MRSARLNFALESGALNLPETGDIAVLRPRAGDDLSALPVDRTVVRSGFKPDVDHFAAQGFRTQGDGPFAMIIVCLPRAKAEARAMLAEAATLLADGGFLVMDGQKTDGIEAVAKDCRALGIDLGEALSKAHGKLVQFAPLPALQGWASGFTDVGDGFVTKAGVFSADGPDAGSVLLAAALPPKLPPRVADLGAGWGYLARAILARPVVTELDVIEAEANALDCAKRNITDPRARFHWADATQFKPVRPWDAVVMNPPFHTGRDADPNLGLAFVKAAHRGLSPSGVLWMVSNRHLPYDPIVTTLFRSVEELPGTPSFRLTRAAYPVRTR